MTDIYTSELGEYLLSIELKIAAMQKEQMDRYQKSILTTTAFLSLDREEDFNNRILQLIKAKDAIIAILTE